MRTELEGKEEAGAEERRTKTDDERWRGEGESG